MGHEGVVADLQSAIPGLVAAYLFGSTGDGSKRSDIDAAVLSSARVDEVELWQLAQTLATCPARLSAEDADAPARRARSLPPQ